jgi:hypothetical protein
MSSSRPSALRSWFEQAVASVRAALVVAVLVVSAVLPKATTG